MLVASEEATFGSVIAKQERISPIKRGVNQVSWNQKEKRVQVWNQVRDGDIDMPLHAEGNIYTVLIGNH